MTNKDDDYVYDDVTGEWRPASELMAAATAKAEVRDASGNVLADGDSVVLVKDLKVKGAGQTLKRSTAGMIPSRDWCCARSLCANAERKISS